MKNTILIDNQFLDEITRQAITVALFTYICATIKY